MAMGRRSRDDAEMSIRNRRPFTNSTGSMRGTRGTTRDLGWLSTHPEARKIKDLLSRAEYVVWSYNTPIGFVSADEDGMETNYYVDESHSQTTSAHQSILRMAFSDFETIGSGPWSRSHTRTGRNPMMPRRVSFDPSVERDTSFERELAETRAQMRYRTAHNEVVPEEDLAARAVPARYLDMQAQSWAGEIDPEARPSRAQMLDPRYGDPDWTPWKRHDGSNLPPGAEDRDEQRVRQTGGTWRP